MRSSGPFNYDVRKVITVIEATPILIIIERPVMYSLNIKYQGPSKIH
jgi:hypothetical protein